MHNVLLMLGTAVLALNAPLLLAKTIAPGGGAGRITGPRISAAIGSVTGRVTDQENGQPVVGAAVTIQGTRLGAITNDSGRYRIAGLSDGLHSVSVRRLGYAAATKPATITPGSEVTLDFVVTRAVTRLEEVVTSVTGLERKVEVGNTTASLAADSLLAHAPITNLNELVATRIPGVQVMFNNGYTGVSQNVRIRGLNSLAGGNNPLLIIDGARVDVTAGGLGFGGVGGGGAPAITAYGQNPGRFNDYNPNDIESIEVVKGAAAGTLYGSDGANGVIVIKTKQGQAGRLQWTLYGEGGSLWIPLGKFPDNYWSWGHTPAGVPRQCRLMDMYVDNLCTIDSLASFNPYKDREQSPIKQGTRQNFGGQISGGLRQFRYFLSTGYENEVGVLEMPLYEQERLRLERAGAAIPEEQIHPNAMVKFTARGNSTAAIGDKGDLAISVGVLTSDTRLPSVGSIFSAGNFAPGIRTANGGWGTSVTTAAPGESFAVRNTDKTTHFTTSINGSWRPSDALSFRATIGHDFSSTFVDDLQRRNEGPFGVNRDGRRQNIKTNNNQITADFGGTYAMTLRPNLSSRTSVGAQFNDRLYTRSVVIGTGLPPGRDVLVGAATYSGSEATSENKTIGAYAEQKMGWNERLFAAVAVRVDGGSTFGKNFQTALYPKASLSWVLSDEPFMPKLNWLSSLRLRTAYGAAGVQPSSTAALSQATFISGQLDGVPISAAYLSSLGNPDLTPEKQGEFEAGADADFFGDRVHVEYTVYDRTSKNALIEQALPSSTAIAFRQANIGSVRNWGQELIVNVRPVDNPRITVDLGFNGALMYNKLVSALTPFNIPNPGINPKSLGNRVGYPLMSRWDKKILSWGDANGNGIIEPSEIVVDTATTPLNPFGYSWGGGSLPTRQATFTPAVTLFSGKVRLSSQFDYRGGHTMMNFNEINRCNVATPNCIGVNDPKADLFQQMRAVAFVKPIGAKQYSGNYWGYFEKGDFTRWREASLSITMPQSVLRVARARSAVLLISMRNVHLWTDYSGVDPEAFDAPGYPYAEGYADNPSQPPPKYFIVRLTLGL